MGLYKGIEIGDDLAGLVSHMDRVEEYRETLQNLQAVWDNLTLLGQLSGTGTDMSATRQAFNRLTGSLLNNLGAETLKKATLAMKSKAQVAIDIMVRNLFERTADIGFLATDDDVRDYLARIAELTEDESEERARLDAALHARFVEYVGKYSVYSNVMLLDLDGRMLVQLDRANPVRQSSDPLIAQSLSTDQAYVETFRHTDLQPAADKSLIYSYKVTSPEGRAIGVMCLCFRFDDETAGIFANLREPGDWSVLSLIDRQGVVIASSDPYHLPLGASVEQVIDAESRIVRFAGREYLAVTRPTTGYQGYMGPGWCGHVMVPLQHAFEKTDAAMLAGVGPAVLAEVIRSPTLFGEALRGIPEQAEQIQCELNRSVWNGNVRQSSDKAALNPAFSKILLWEISNTGLRTKDVFERSIGNLNETVVSAILQESRFVASLAIDIMDRNLYERANDCRWWALTSAFRRLLAQGARDEAARAKIAAILTTINGLYTVYDNLVVFDRQGRVLAVSNSKYDGFVGQALGEDWARQALALRDSQSYCVSAFQPSELYDGRHTYVYAAAIRDPDDKAKVVGGIGIVFDAAPQFEAMLADSLPRNEGGEVTPGAFGLFADRAGAVIASTNPDIAPGSRLDLDQSFFALGSGEGTANIAAIDGRHYAVGSRMSKGYREYKSPQDSYRNDVVALIFVPLCAATGQGAVRSIERRRLQLNGRSQAEGDKVEIATFHVGPSWFGIRSDEVVEAVAASGITRVPGAASSLIGYAMFHGSPIPVLDIAVLMRGVSDRAGPPSQMVVVRGKAGQHFAIIVDELGEIPEVPVSRIEPIDDLAGGDSMLAQGIARLEDSAGNSDMLILLSPERIVAAVRLSRGQPAELAVAAQ